MTVKEYAKLNGCSEAAAKKRMQRARPKGTGDTVNVPSTPKEETKGTRSGDKLAVNVPSQPKGDIKADIRLVTVSPNLSPNLSPCVEPRLIDNQPPRIGNNLPAPLTPEQESARGARIAARRAKSKIWQDEEAKRTREFGPIIETGETFTLQSGEVIRIRRRVKDGGD